MEFYILAMILGIPSLPTESLLMTGTEFTALALKIMNTGLEDQGLRVYKVDMR